MIGSEVGYWMGFMNGVFYKKFFLLWCRVLMIEERKILFFLNVGYNSMLNLNIMLVKVFEIEKVIRGSGE